MPIVLGIMLVFGGVVLLVLLAFLVWAMKEEASR